MNVNCFVVFKGKELGKVLFGQKIEMKLKKTEVAQGFQINRIITTLSMVYKRRLIRDD